MSSVAHELPAVSSSAPIKHVAIRQAQMADHLPGDYSSTPGGTIFSTTPGGTRIIYDRAFLMQCRESPLACTPPTNLPMIPGVTCPKQKKNHHKGSSPLSTSPGKSSPLKNKFHAQGSQSHPHSSNSNEDAQFHMDL